MDTLGPVLSSNNKSLIHPAAKPLKKAQQPKKNKKKKKGEDKEDGAYKP